MSYIVSSFSENLHRLLNQNKTKVHTLYASILCILGSLFLNVTHFCPCHVPVMLVMLSSLLLLEHTGQVCVLEAFYWIFSLPITLSLCIYKTLIEYLSFHIQQEALKWANQAGLVIHVRPYLQNSQQKGLKW